MSHSSNQDPVIVVHYAGTSTEAMVIRGLLESAGISSPASTFTDPFPLRETPKGTHGSEIEVLASQAEEARRIISEYLSGGGQEKFEQSQEDPRES